MVEVVTSKEFDEFKKLVEDRLDKMEKGWKDDLAKAVVGLTTLLDEASATIIKRVDDVEEKSKSIVTRIKEAFELPESNGEGGSDESS